MNKQASSLLTLLIAQSCFANWGVSVGYGVFVPLSSKSNFTVKHNKVTDGNPTAIPSVPNTSSPETTTPEMQLTNPKIMTAAVQNSNGLGILYEGSLKDVAFKPVVANTKNGMNDFKWGYKAYYLNYRFPFAKSMAFNIGLGTAKQNFSNVSVANKSVSSKDISARAGLSANMSLGQGLSLAVSVNYKYLKDFAKTLDINTATTTIGDVKLLDAVVDVKTHGVAGAVELSYNF